MLESLYTHERCNLYRLIANLKKAIAELEAISPRTPKIEAELKKSKDIEQQLLKASKDPGFIKNLMNKSLMEIKTKAETLSNSQSKRASKPRKTRNMTPEERDTRNANIRADYAKSKLELTAFAIHHEKNGTYEKGNGKKLSASGIKKVIYNK